MKKRNLKKRRNKKEIVIITKDQEVEIKKSNYFINLRKKKSGFDRHRSKR